MRSPLLLCFLESDFRAGIKHEQLLLFPESDRSYLHRVVDGKSSIIDQRLIFIILRIFFVFVMIVTVNFTLFKITVLVCNRQVRLDLAMLARAIMRLVLSCSSCSMFLRPCFCSPDRSVRSLVG
jgi:hypothetical protein